MSGPARHLVQRSEVDPVLDDLLEGFANRLAAGGPVDVEAFVGEHPERAEALRRMLPVIQVLAELESSGAASASAGPGGPEPRSALGRLGDYRILREVGRGGMGVVYEAEQVSLNRRVALKVLPFAAALDPRQLARFQNEARAAACLHHTHIVPVFGVGCERGVHFYAMQFIEGRTLAEVIAQLREPAGGEPSPPERAASEPQPTGPYTPGAAPTAPGGALTTQRAPAGAEHSRTAARLGIEAAEALEHAHQLGVVHRDIKPGNLMVESRGHLWVTDFGVAQVQTDTRLTLTGDVLGTLRYMSPEQALGQCAVVDHRSDVYSLGVTLYELLTLEPAFGGRDRQELLRQIASEEPKPPRRLNKAVPRELETILGKAMEKSPADRYATAQELADDLRRFLEDRPIRARRPGVVARVRKWSWRHRGPVSAAVVSAVLVLAVTSGVIAWQWRLAEARRAQAEHAARTVRAINDFLVKDMLAAGTPEHARGRKVTAEEVLDRAAAKVEGAFPGQPEVEAEVRMAIGSAYRSLALYAKAEPHFRRAVRIRQERLGGEHRDTLEALKQLASLWADWDRYAEAERLCRQTLDTARRVLGADDPLTLALEHVLAYVLMEQDRRDESEELFRRCLQRRTLVLGADHPDTLGTMIQLTLLLGERRGKWQEAEPLARHCVEVRERTLGKDHPDTLDARTIFADAVLKVKGEWQEAEALQRETLAIARRALGRGHDATLVVEHNLAIVLALLDRLDEAERCFRECVAVRSRFSSPEDPEVLKSRWFLASVLLARGKLDEAEQEFRDTLESSRRVRGPDDMITLQALGGTGLVHQARGRWAEAEAALRQALRGCRRAHKPEESVTLATVRWLAVLLDLAGKHAEAGPLFRTGLEARRKLLPPGHPELALFLAAWAEHLLAEGDLRRAEPALTEALRIERATLPPGHRALGQTLSALGWLYARSGRAREGKPPLQEALNICRRAFPAGHWVTADTASRLGDCLAAQKDFGEAEPLLLGAYRALRGIPGAPPPRLAQAVERIVRLYEATGQPDKAAAWRAKLPRNPGGSPARTSKRSRRDFPAAGPREGGR